MVELSNFMTSEIGGLCQISARADPFNIHELRLDMKYLNGGKHRRKIQWGL